MKREEVEKLAIEAAVEGGKLAVALSQELDRLGVGFPVLMHAMAHIMAGYLIDCDSWISHLEALEGKLMTEEERLQVWIDEVKELAAQGRANKVRMEAEGHGPSTGQKH